MFNFGYPQSFGVVIPTVRGLIVCNRYDRAHTPVMVRTANEQVSELSLLGSLLKSAPNGVVCLDIGGNYGLYGLALARFLLPKNGVCHSFEAQRIMAYAAAGTVALSGLNNLYIHHVAIGDTCGEILIPKFDYNKKANFAGIEFGSEQKEPLGQERKSSSSDDDRVSLVTIDSLNFENVYLMKMDIEGMEIPGLKGAETTIRRDKPILFIEYFKSGKKKVASICKDFGYHVYLYDNMNFLCIHSSKRNDYKELELGRMDVKGPEIRLFLN